MPDQVQLRGGTEAENNNFTGAAREVTVDTTNKTLRVHDGETAGGSKLAAYDQWGRLQTADPVNDTDVANKQWVEGHVSGAATRRALVIRDDVQTIPNATTTAMIFQTEVYDDDGMFDIGSPTMLVVPSGASKVRVSASVVWGSNADGLRQAFIERDTGAGFTASYNGVARFAMDPGTSNQAYWTMATAWIACDPGDKFQLAVHHTRGTTLQMQGSGLTWMMMEILT